MPKHAWTVALVWVACVWTSDARSDSTRSAATAQKLFDAGVALKQRGQYAVACSKLEESQELDPGLGTQYHLADCYEKQGRTAAALALFEDIARQAAISKQKERSRIALERAAEVAPKVPRITIAVPIASDVAGLEIARDGNALRRDAWNKPIAVDPGTHEIVAHVGDRSWRRSVTLEAKARDEIVVVPDFTPIAPAASAAMRTPLPRTMGWSEEPKPATEGRRTVGLGIGAAGLVGLGAGTFFLLRAMDHHDRAEQLGCGGSTCKSPSGVSASSDAVAAGNAATVAYALGAVATGVGIYLIATPSRPERNRPQIGAAIGPTGVSLRGAL